MSAPAARPPPRSPSGSDNTQLIQMIGGVLVGVGIIALMYKFVFADKQAVVSTKPEPKDVKEPEVSKEIVYPCFEEEQLEPCEERVRRFSLDGSLCCWRHYLGIFGKPVLCRGDSEKKESGL
ncbi:unnamed protein product [Arctia plantaginis]|uniref:Uncharacterized protein n=1 Tax=Arctia plantaginis TaxID=874455 RepID=A0A8S0ZAR9_ARCPL|nr:unnamed protein product [Arctia plantaginis]